MDTLNYQLLDGTTVLSTLVFTHTWKVVLPPMPQDPWDEKKTKMPVRTYDEEQTDRKLGRIDESACHETRPH